MTCLYTVYIYLFTKRLFKFVVFLKDCFMNMLKKMFGISTKVYRAKDALPPLPRSNSLLSRFFRKSLKALYVMYNVMIGTQLLILAYAESIRIKRWLL